ncbi:MAG: 2-oxoacid ferredoxin oxidoreductase [bacterium]|nr:2-oxoacid ferredoxin oxidoreductase [bacterium]
MVTAATQPLRPEFVPASFKSELKPIWCKGCGNYAVLTPIHKALAEVGVPPHEVAVISGIGCSSRIPGYCATYGFNSIHGRALPIATGVKLAKPHMTVIAAGGDGDGLSIGGGHFPHAGRRNVDITYIMMDNEIYGLTKGQASPSTPVGDLTKTTPYGSMDRPLDAASLALAYNVSFVARCFVGEGAHLVQTITEAIRHPGFAFVHILSPCPTFRGVDEFKEIRQHIEFLPDDYKTDERNAAFTAASRTDGKISLGVFFREERATLVENADILSEKAKAKGKNTIQEIFSQFMP